MSSTRIPSNGATLVVVVAEVAEAKHLLRTLVVDLETKD